MPACTSVHSALQTAAQATVGDFTAETCLVMGKVVILQESHCVACETHGNTVLWTTLLRGYCRIELVIHGKIVVVNVWRSLPYATCTEMHYICYQPVYTGLVNRSGE